jgi:hypothetical protein
MPFFPYFDDHVLHIVNFLDDATTARLLRCSRSLVPLKMQKGAISQHRMEPHPNSVLYVKQFKPFDDFNQNHTIPAFAMTGTVKELVLDGGRWRDALGASNFIAMMPLIALSIECILFINTTKAHHMELLTTVAPVITKINRSIKIASTENMRELPLFVDALSTIFTGGVEKWCVICENSGHYNFTCKACHYCKKVHQECPLCTQKHPYTCSIPFITHEHQRGQQFAILGCPTHPFKPCYVCGSVAHTTRYHPCSTCGQKHMHGKKTCKHPLYCDICNEITDNHNTTNHPCAKCRVNAIAHTKSAYCKQCEPCDQCGEFKETHKEKCICICGDPNCDVKRTEVMLRDGKNRPVLVSMPNVNWCKPGISRIGITVWNCLFKKENPRCQFCKSHWHASEQHRRIDRPLKAGVIATCAICNNPCNGKKPVFGRFVCHQCKICTICYKPGHTEYEHRCPCGKLHPYEILVQQSKFGLTYWVPHTVFYKNNATLARKQIERTFGFETGVSSNIEYKYLQYRCKG